mgnify:CR=1 FL=1
MSFFWHSPRLSLPEQTGGFFSCLSIIPHFFEKCKGFCKIFFQLHDFFYFCIWKRCWLQKMSHLFEILFPITSRRQTKSFSVQQFFKNAAEVWASSPHLRSKLDLQMKSNKNLGEHRKNRNCLKNQKDVMRDKVSGAIAIPKASWGCAPALPNRIREVFLGQAAGE